jgi:hypothetical protein
VHCGLKVNERDKWPDPVRRMKDHLDLHAVARQRGYVAFNLRTGEPVTGDAHTSRALARKYAERKTMDALVICEIQPDGCTYQEADAALRFERALNSRGYRTPDSLETEENSGALSLPRTRYDRKRLARQLLSGRPLYPEGISYTNLPMGKGH